MTAPTGAYVLKNALLKFGGTTFTNQVTKARLVPDVNRETMKTLVPDGVVQDINVIWALELSGVQDWESGGLAAYLNTNQGTQVSVTVAGVAATGKQQAVCTVVCQPVEFGGEQGNWNTFDTTLGVVGAPVFSAQP